MHAPQWIYVVIVFAALLWAAHQHGRTEEWKWNFWRTFAVQTAIIFLLWWGGFFGR